MTEATTTAKRAVPRFYFSFRSPYSWLAYLDLVGRYPEVADSLTWIPFWEPDDWSQRMLAEARAQFIYSPMSREKHLYVLQDVRRLAVERGITVTWPVDQSPWWEVPHLAYLVAARHGRGREFIDRVYHARWQEGRDICDRETVAVIASDLGLDPDELAGAADDPGVREEALQALLAIHRDGVFGVPFFVHRYDKYWGVDRLRSFVGRLRASGSSARSPDPVPASPVEVGRLTTDEGHAGGCG